MYENIHPELKSKLFRDQFIGAPIFGLIGIVIFIGSFFIVDKNGSHWSGGMILVPLAISAIFLWASFYSWNIRKNYERISWVFYEVEAVPMYVSFSIMDTGGLNVTLVPSEKVLFDFNQITFMCFAPNWDYLSLENKIVQVKFDPKPGGPVVIETPEGIIWSLITGVSQRT